MAEVVTLSGEKLAAPEAPVAAALAALFQGPGRPWPDGSDLGPDFAPSTQAARCIEAFVAARDGWDGARLAAERIASHGRSPRLLAQRLAAIWLALGGRLQWRAEEVARAFRVGQADIVAAAVAVSEALARDDAPGLRAGLAEIREALSRAEPP